VSTTIFRCPSYLLDSVRMLMVKNGDLSLLGNYMLVGLGGGFDSLPQLLEDPRDVSGYARTIRTFTGVYRGARVSVVAMGGGTSYAEWVVALAAMRRVRALIGVGWCGALQEWIGIGDAVIPIAVARDEDTTRHYVPSGFPAAADYSLLRLAEPIARRRLEGSGARLWIGVTVSTSAMLAEDRDWVSLWGGSRALCVDCESSTIYALSYLAGVPALAMLAVSDNVATERDCGFGTELSERVESTFVRLAQSALETFAEVERSRGSRA